MGEETGAAEFDKLPGRFERAARRQTWHTKEGQNPCGRWETVSVWLCSIIDVFSFTLLTIYLHSSSLEMFSPLGRPRRLPGLTTIPSLDPFSCTDRKQARDFAISLNDHGAELVNVTSETRPQLGVLGKPPLFSLLKETLVKDHPLLFLLAGNVYVMSGIHAAILQP